MPFSPASRLSDQSRVWVERSIFEGVDQALEANFGPAQGQTATAISLRFAAMYSDEGQVGSLANPFSGVRATNEPVA